MDADTNGGGARMELAEVIERLRVPFEPELVSWKPGATSQDKSQALALAYVEPRAYIDRLNEVAGDWSDDYEIHANGAVVLCRLTIGGVTRCDVGEASPGDQNTATSAVAQAFKRACVRFGLGAYLYSLPRVWVEYDAQRKGFTTGALARLRASVSNGNGQGRGGDGPHYGNGVRVGNNQAEVDAFRAYVEEVGQVPQDVYTLRSWYASRGK
jgi:hypothetical protein